MSGFRGRNAKSVTNRMRLPKFPGQLDRKKSEANVENGENGAQSLDVSLFATIFLAIFMIGVGAGLTTIYFKIRHPDCLQGIFSASTASSHVRRIMKETGHALDELIVQVIPSN
jgi:hypothetical protein